MDSGDGLDSSANGILSIAHLNQTGLDLFVVAAPVIGHEGHFVTLTYTRLTIPEVSYVVEQPDDLSTWTTASTIDETVSTTGSSSVIKAKIDVTTKTRLFLRLRTVQPSS